MNRSTEWSEIDFSSIQKGQPSLTAVVRVGSLLGGEEDDEKSASSSVLENEKLRRDPVMRTSSTGTVPRKKIERKKSSIGEDSTVRVSTKRPALAL
jgi:hypothetical protein